MKKFFSFLLLTAATLLVGGNAWALVPVGGIAEPGLNGVVVEISATQTPIRKIVAEETDPVYVAQIFGGESYATLQEAINAATAGDEIKLLADVIDDPTKAYNYRVFLNKNVTIDMDGHKIVGNYAYGAIVGSACVATVKNGEIDNNWASTSYNCFAIFTQNAANLTLENVLVCGKKWALFPQSGCTMTINGSSSRVWSTEGYAIYARNTNSSSSTIININGGEVYSEKSGSRVVNLDGNCADYSGADTRDAYPVILNVRNAKVYCDLAESYGVIATGKGAEVNVYDGADIYAGYFAIAGNGTAKNGGTTFNIYGGKIGSNTTSEAIYHPQMGTLNIYGGELFGLKSCVEFRGGTANISGGHFYCSKSYADNDDHSNGSSTEGCGFGINPYYDVTVNITGGTFEAYCPFYQAQATGADKTITTTISGGKFKAINGSKKTIWAETTNKFITGGLYNLSPAAYVAENKAVVPYTDPDGVYKFAIADVETAVTFTTAGQWNVAGNWSAEATSATPVVIAADCEIANGVVANVYGLTLNSGKTLTVKKGAKLIIGAEGLVNNAGAANLIIEDGAYVAINPVATNTQFAATVHHASQTRALTESEKSASSHHYTMLWEVCANPIGNASITFPASATDVRASRWSNGWVGVNNLSEIATPFGAYMMATNAATVGEDIHWTGTTNGVANNSIAASNAGWYFVGNSYLAPIDIVELIDNLGANVEKQIYMYKASTETFQQITRATAGTGSRFDVLNSVVEPKSGFFVRATGSATIDLDYTQSVWDALNAKVAAAAAPARHKVIVAPRQEIEHTAKMELAVQSLDDKTRYSVLDIFEAAAYTTDKQDDYDFTAFINQSPNINFVAVQYGVQLNAVSLPNLNELTLAFNTGTSTSLRIYFDNVEGTTYYLHDAVTKTYTPIVDGTYYDFSVAAPTGDDMVSDRFTVVARSSDITTDVETVENYETTKCLNNANLFIQKDGHVYNVLGQKVK